MAKEINGFNLMSYEIYDDCWKRWKQLLSNINKPCNIYYECLFPKCTDFEIMLSLDEVLIVREAEACLHKNITLTIGIPDNIPNGFIYE